MDPKTQFSCLPYRCTMQLNACAKRFIKARRRKVPPWTPKVTTKKHGGSKPLHPLRHCAGCPLGELAANSLTIKDCKVKPPRWGFHGEFGGTDDADPGN